MTKSAKLMNVLRWFSVRTAEMRGTGLPRISEALRRRYQAKWSGGEVLLNHFQGDIRIQVDPVEHMGSCITWFDAYSKAEIQLIQKLLKPGDCFVDVGANIGEFTLVAARSVGTGGRVIAFEPVPAIRSRLQNNVDLNGFSWVEVRPEALGAEDRPIELFTGDYHGAAHGGLPTAFKTRERAISVGTARQVRFDDLWPDLRPSPVAGMKLDIEGGELAALRGAEAFIERFRPWMICEIGEETCKAAGYEPRTIYEFITERNYSISVIREGGRLDRLYDAGELQAWQNVFARPLS